ncbi:hypothetical protein Rsub_00294 [Raphidocelis subcapitata]|uniref:Ubiquitin-like protease family profile domain-containing protein n=1 Tax=Raphidocelis subcapitata TaxID=307507 RepID=A0A2V0NPZ1_9CHLO|nr:hypothetical protein Rsub_00294 [Raphidocelis subcapitata]|eukprot:GBF87583.1 hypothetical protein Rsub_00294 [Raphidocelis subcapitata]
MSRGRGDGRYLSYGDVLLRNSDVALLEGPYWLNDQGLVLLPVSDNTDVDAAGGGSHWSLLAFHRPSGSFLHFDSSPGGGNARHARQLAGAASPLVRDRGNGGGGGGARLPAFEECRHAPRQANGHDCGVYVLAVAELLLRWHAADGAPLRERLEQLPALVTPAAAAAKRAEVLAVARQLAAAEAEAAGSGGRG